VLVRLAYADTLSRDSIADGNPSSGENVTGWEGEFWFEEECSREARHLAQ
jgi:hypothetical protein